jgi:hypothetical protein
LVSQDKRHLVVTPCVIVSSVQVNDIPIVKATNLMLTWVSSILTFKKIQINNACK